MKELIDDFSYWCHDTLIPILLKIFYWIFIIGIIACPVIVIIGGIYAQLDFFLVLVEAILSSGLSLLCAGQLVPSTFITQSEVYKQIKNLRIQPLRFLL